MNIEQATYLPQGTKVTFESKVYDFGYVSQTGSLVLYEVGERNMRDSIAVKPDGVSLVEAP